ncbi:MAG TPA: helix-turn-helix domain-containing protein [Longimicrobium sp.]|nr:helix-turn-helix domain-containing protein [Longimicrobium sp.]
MARRSREVLSAAARDAATTEARDTVTLEEVELPVSVVHALVRILDELAEGRDVAVLSEGEGGEVTTSQAAELLGMSRPTLINLLEAGEIPFRKVGTHRRMALADVLAYRRHPGHEVPREPSREERLRALGEMAEYTDRLGLGY